MIGRHYAFDDARIAAARAAHLAALLRSDLVPEDLTSLAFDATAINELENKTLDSPLTILNRLRRLNPEAFFHWVRIQSALDRTQRQPPVVS